MKNFVKEEKPVLVEEMQCQPQNDELKSLIGGNESVDNIQSLLEHLTIWLEENPSINGRKDTVNLLNFLRGSKYDLERTKTKIKSYYTMRAERTEWFDNRDPFLPEIQELLQIGVFIPLDEKDDQNRQIVVIRTSAHNPKLHSQNNVLKVSKMILDILLHLQPDVTLNGIVAIFDMHNVQLGHALQMTPSIIKKSVDSWQVYPTRPQLLEFVNAPTHVNMFLNTFRFFMTAKMKSRLVVRKSSSDVKAKLPKELGGPGPTYEDLAAKWKTIVEENAAFFEEDGKYKTLS